MELFIFIFEIVGTVAFAVSGAMTGVAKHMDIFGVSILGLTTATGGGLIRDVFLGITPPAAFVDPVYALIACGVSILAFFAFTKRITPHEGRGKKIFDLVLLSTDSAGLGIFTVCGVRAAISHGYAGNAFLVIFVAVVTGVGGGVLRDIFAGDRPYIFVKHIYACASLAGAVLTVLLWNFAGQSAAMLSGFAAVTLIRLLAAKFRWSLPKA